jgi:hypothetical protein
VEQCVRVEQVIEPDPALQSTYEGGYEHFKALYPALRQSLTP